MASIKESAYLSIVDNFKDCLDRFKYINKAVDSMFKNLNSVLTDEKSAVELLKLYNNTYLMQLKSYEILNQILSKFPSDLSPQEFEMIELYRSLPESMKCDILRILKGAAYESDRKVNENIGK